MLERSKDQAGREQRRGTVRFLVEFEIFAEVEEVEVEMVDREGQCGDVS